MLHVFTFLLYAFLDLGSTLSFVTHLITSRFDVFLNVLHEPILVSTPIGDGIRAERVYKNFKIHTLDKSLVLILWN